MAFYRGRLDSTWLFQQHLSVEFYTRSRPHCGCQCDFPFGILVVGRINNVQNELLEMLVHMISNLRFTREKKNRIETNERTKNATDDDDDDGDGDENRMKRFKVLSKVNATRSLFLSFVRFVHSWHRGCVCMWTSFFSRMHPLQCA